MSALLYESHSHTPLCKHAIGTPGEYAEVASQRGLRGVIITCHNPIPDGYSSHVRMDPEEFPQYVDLVQASAEEWKDKVDIRLGIECDYAPGMESYIEKFLQSQPFHHVLGSVHPQIPEYRQRYFNGDYFEYQKVYFDHLALAAETGFFDTLSHPDLVKNESPESWDIERILPFICDALDRIAAEGTAMELNTSGANKSLPQMNPAPEILREMRIRGIPVVLGADAHRPSRVGDGYEIALDLLKDAGFQSVSFFLNRNRYDIPIADARKSLISIDSAVQVPHASQTSHASPK